MSKVFNMVGGGGGKNISSIIITGLESTDTVTCTKDGKSYTATWYETAQHWEIVGLPLGTFTVTATNGTKTKTKTVLIDITGVYEIEMGYLLWLYKDGDECDDVTGGWPGTGWYSSSSIWSVASYPTMNTNNIYYEIPGSYKVRVGGPLNKIDLTGWSSIHIECVATSIEVCVTANKDWENRSAHLITSSSSVGTIVVDISNLTGEYYIQIGTGGTSGTATIYKVWLE